jgi:hypothetical protein
MNGHVTISPKLYTIPEGVLFVQGPFDKKERSATFR